ANMKMTFLIGPDSTHQLFPRINVLNETMRNESIEEYIKGNRKNLENDVAFTVTFNEEGIINTAERNIYWYSYTKDYNNIKREMMFYSIPVNGISYCFTAGVGIGGMQYYRSQFDTIVKSFKFVQQ
ncbi:MAG: hypothetical protein RI955_866, partial [Bacteroidota bacterium]